MSEQKDISLEDKQTLIGFIKDHEKILTSIGVFGALTAFFTTIENGAVLVIFSYLIFLLLCLELTTQFPKFTEYYLQGTKTIKLFIFQMLLYFLMGMLFVYVIYYQPLTIVFVILFSLLVSIFYWGHISVPVNNYLDYHKKTGKVVRFTIGGLIIIGLFLLIMIIFVAIVGILVYFGVIAPLW